MGDQAMKTCRSSALRECSVGQIGSLLGAMSIWLSGCAIYRILRLLPQNCREMPRWWWWWCQLKIKISSWYFPDDPEFTELIRQAELAVDDGVFPQRIYQVAQNKFIQQERKVFLQAFPIVLLRFRAQAGATLWRTGRVWPLGCSSQKTKSLMGGSIPSGQNGCTACVVHVVLAGSQIIITRWAYILINAQCFRSCLIPNQGYMSEAGASLVDQKLGLNVVPKTKVVKLASETFNYLRIDVEKSKAKKVVNEHFPKVGRKFNRIGLPPKKGSFQVEKWSDMTSCWSRQMFVSGFKDADFHLRKFENAPLEPETARDFQVCLAIKPILFLESFEFTYHLTAAIWAVGGAGLHHPQHRQGQWQLVDQVHQTWWVKAGNPDQGRPREPRGAAVPHTHRCGGNRQRAGFPYKASRLMEGLSLSLGMVTCCQGCSIKLLCVMSWLNNPL